MITWRVDGRVYKEKPSAALPFRLLHVKLHGLCKRTVSNGSTLNAIKTIKVPYCKKTNKNTYAVLIAFTDMGQY